MFYKPDNGWCGDVIPFYKDGTYYLYYLHDYRNPKEFGEGMPWFLVTTQDFVTFEEYGEVLPRGSREAHDLYVFTGCVFEDIRQVTPYPYHIYYTVHNPHYQKQGKPLEKVVHAVSNDLIHWEKQQDISYEAPAGYECDDWRDPFVWYSEEKRAYCMLTAARFPEGPSRYRGCTALSVSEDLIHWRIDAPMLAEGNYYTHECPDYFCWNGWYYLIFSEFSDTCRTRYRMSRSPFGPWKKPQDDMFDARGFYAAKTAGDGEKRYIFGWNTTRTGDNDSGKWMWGSHIIVHELKQRRDGTLYAVLPESVANAYSATTPVGLTDSFGIVVQQGETIKLNAALQTGIAVCGAMADEMVLKAAFRMDAGVSSFGALLRMCQAMDQMYYVFYDFDACRFAVERYPSLQPEWPIMLEMERFYQITPAQEVTLTIFVQDSLLEAYIASGDDGDVLSSRIYDLKDGNFGFFAKGGCAEVTAQVSPPVQENKP